MYFFFCVLLKKYLEFIIKRIEFNRKFKSDILKYILLKLFFRDRFSHAVAEVNFNGILEHAVQINYQYLIS